MMQKLDGSFIWRHGLPDTLAVAAVVAAFIGYYIVSVGEEIVAGVVFTLLWVAATMFGGSLVLRVADPDELLERHFPLTFIVGILSVSAVMTLTRFFLPIEPWLVLVVLLGLALLGLRAVAGPSGFGRNGQRADDFAPLLAVVVSLMATTIWCQIHLPPFIEVDGQTVYRPFNDTFILAQLVPALKAAPLPQFWGNFEFFGQPLPLYHYGGFVLSGAYASFTGADAITTIDGFVTPLGFLLAPLSIYVLAAHWWGKRAALASLAVGVLLPDASHYLFGGWLFSYYYYLDFSPSLGWGIACITVALLLLSAGTRCRRWLLVAGSAVAGACVFIFKAQLFVAAVPILVARFLAADMAGSLRLRVMLALLVVAVGVTGLLVVEYVQIGPTNALDPFGGLAFLNFTTWFMVEQTGQRFSDFFSSLPRLAIPVVGAPYLLLISFGVLPLIYFALLLRRGFRREATLDDLLPLAGIASFLFLALMLAQSRNVGGWYELQHRPFILVYALLAAWCGGAVVHWLSEMSLKSTRGWWLACLPVLFVAPIALAPSTGLYRYDQYRGQFFNVTFADGYLRCIGYLREHSEPTDVVQDSRNDPHLYTMGLSERRAFLARPSATNRDRHRGAPEKVRLEQLVSLRSAADALAVAEVTAQLPIRWFLMHPESTASWLDDALVQPVFASGGYRLYDFERLARLGLDRTLLNPAPAEQMPRDRPVTVLHLDPAPRNDGLAYLAWPEALVDQRSFTLHATELKDQAVLLEQLQLAIASTDGSVVLSLSTHTTLSNSRLVQLIERLGGDLKLLSVRDLGRDSRYLLQVANLAVLQENLRRPLSGAVAHASATDR